MRKEIEQALELLHTRRLGALDQALALLQGTVFSFSMKVCGHRQDAEDTMQEVLLKAMPYLPKFSSPKALVVWLYTVAKNRCLMSRRRSKFAPQQNLSLEELMPDRQELADLTAPDRSTPEQSYLRGEDDERVRQAVLKVPPRYRLVLVLHDMEELSTEEIARVTGLRAGTVRVRLHRARLFVRRELASKAATPRKPRPQPARARAPHPDARCKQLFAALSEYLDDRLDDSTCDRLQQHMAGCQPCEAFLASLESTVQGLRHYSPAADDGGHAVALRQELLRQYRDLLQSLPHKRGRRAAGERQASTMPS